MTDTEAIPTPPAPVAVLVTGARGQLGSDLVLQATAAGLPVVAFGSAELDITDGAAVRAALEAFAAGLPGEARGVVINAAAYTAVDAAETDEARAYAVNEQGPAHLARSAADLGLGLIHVSTDYVFPGDATEAYPVDAPTGPRSVYGASKLAGERAVLAAHPDAHVVRTAWVYGAAGGNFVKTMAALEASRPELSVVDDQQGTPTYSADLAAGLLELATRPVASVPGGVLHLTNAGRTTWFHFARAIFTELGADPARVNPTTTDAFPRPAPRPAFSVLSPDAWTAAGLTPLRSWQDALTAALAEHPAAFKPA
ncbi:dTDP-4-dehydrorhamnose reductase [Nakamurella leprariae]|uniref:dTDP-4-dehydrorhamnose reductase n=1 Tax=Nakamurella leprariae TaxID=2803911 RepID=A0A939C219_9ACTN|nr:dTDP-4-dehydrorhamnose reductase [Nakamurella leprariae]MBM9467697.1 dTDP-4-dehydrorhamnose reductase [Nakamurella leprariae]